MTEQLTQIAKDEIAKLPAEMQKVMGSLDWAEISKSIGVKHLFSEENINKLQTEVLLVLVGMEYLNNLATNIEENIITSKPDAEQIASELKTQIFKPIAEQLNENVKNNLSFKKPSWDQTINFIISGGDYSNFI